MLRSPRLPLSYTRRGPHSRLTQRAPLPLTASLRSYSFNFWRRIPRPLRVVLVLMGLGLAVVWWNSGEGRQRVSGKELDALLGKGEELVWDVPEPDGSLVKESNQQIFSGDEEEDSAAIPAPRPPAAEEPTLRPAIPDPPSPPPKPQNPHIRPRPAEVPAHSFLPNGLLEVNPAGRHPIYDLIERAEEEWAAKLARASKTLEQAVGEYRRRYGRKPPRGFDKWWAYVQRHDVQLPDEYDQILADLGGFHAYSPADLRRLQTTTRKQPGTYTLGTTSGSRGTVELLASSLAQEEEARGFAAAREQLDLLAGFGEDWVDGETRRRTSVGQEIWAATGEWEATFSLDGPRELADWGLYEERRLKAEAREYMGLFRKSQSDYLGWGAACPPSSPLREDWPFPPSLPLPPPNPKTFVHSPLAASDTCLHPQLVQTSEFLLSYPGRGPVLPLQPRLWFGGRKTAAHGDVLVAAGWAGEGEKVRWEEKEDKAVWRGAVGDLEVGARAEQGERMRLVRMVNERSEADYPVLLPGSDVERVGQAEPRSQAVLNRLADGAFTGEAPSQLSNLPFAPPLTPAEEASYKYLISLSDPPSSFLRLLGSGSVVLQSSVFQDWYAERMLPWVHYVPLSTGLSELYDTLLFFRGDPERGVPGQDALARAIGDAGREWTRRFGRREDAVAYTWRLFLEYGRLVSDERNAMVYDLPEPEPEEEDG